MRYLDVPRRGQMSYSRNLYDFRPNIDRLAEEQIERSDRYSRDNLQRLERSGIRSANDVTEVSDRLASGFGSLPDKYRKGTSDNIKLEDQSAEAQWRKKMMQQAQAEESSSGLNTSGANEYTNPTLEYLKGNTSTQEYVGMPTRVDTKVTPSRQLTPEYRTSGGAAAVLDGKLKPGINPAQFSARSEEEVAQYPELKPKPVMERRAQLMPSTQSPIKRAAMSNREAMWTAERDKAIAAAEAMRRGKLADPLAQERLDIDREKLKIEREKIGKKPDGTPAPEKAPPGYRFRPDGNLEAIPGGPADKKPVPGKPSAPGKQDSGPKPPAGYRFKPDGSLEAIPGGPADKGPGGKPEEKPLREGEQNAAMFYNNADNALKVLEKMEDEGFRPDLGTALKTQLPGMLQGYALSPKEQMYIQAAKDFNAAKLRLESGASIPPSEELSQALIYMVRPGDSPEVIAQKRASRKKALEGLKFKAGRGADMIQQGQTPTTVSGKVKVRNANGETFEIDRSDLEDAKKDGFSPVE